MTTFLLIWLALSLSFAFGVSVGADRGGLSLSRLVLSAPIALPLILGTNFVEWVRSGMHYHRDERRTVVQVWRLALLIGTTDVKPKWWRLAAIGSVSVWWRA